MQKSHGLSALNPARKDAAVEYVRRLYSQSGRSDLIKVLKRESFKRIYKRMSLSPESFLPSPRPTGIEPWHGIKPQGPKEFLESKVVLPSLPQIQFQLQQVLNNPDSTLEELIEIISRDPKLVAAVIRLANSGLFSLKSRVDTPAKAVELLGFDEAGSLALGTVSLSLFKRSKVYVLDAEKFWKHSIACGVIAQEIARALKLSDPERFFVGGMLHDIGLYVIFESDYGLALELLDLAKHKGDSLYHAEFELLGFSHAMLGGVILKRWNFPRPLVAAAVGHHNPGKVKTVPDAMVIHVADFIARGLGYDLGVSSVLGFLDHKAWDKTGLTGEQLIDMLPTIQELIEDIFEILDTE